MNPVRIKVCGITRSEDAALADEMSVDAIGFVFVGKSKRFVEIEVAAGIARETSPFMQCVGLFLDDEPALVLQALAAIPALLPQFHGTETASYCDQFERPYIKAMGVANGMPSSEEMSAYRNCSGFLFDSNAPGKLGGTGHTFDWDKLVGSEHDAQRRLILAGGLNPDNIAAAIQQVQPYAVDVSTGVETSPGIKDAALVRDFVTRARGSNNDVANDST